LNAFTDVTWSTSSWDKLFQRLMTRCVKNWRRASQWQRFFRSFLQLWPLVTLFSDLLKNRPTFQRVLEKPLTNLKSSVRSVLLRRSWETKDQAGKVYHHMTSFELQRQARESMLDTLKQFNVLDIVWIPNRWAIIQMRSNKGLVEV